LKFIGMLVFLLSLVAPATASAETLARFHTLHNLVRSSVPLSSEVRVANRNDQDQMLCLALNIYHEAARGNPRDQWAVGFVTLNRIKHRAFNAKTICQVVWAKSQFSWTVRAPRTLLPRELAVWTECQRKASLLIAGEKMNDPTNGSTHFYQARLNPGWARRLVDKIRIGVHMYARLPGRS
jgi:spore germination cell wall hydrolase CwlJ-like protein